MVQQWYSTLVMIENTSMKALLSQLNSESYLLDIKSRLDINSQLIKPELDGYSCRLLDDHTLEVDVAKNRGLNSLIAQLATMNIQVQGIRNKENRLEALFMNIVEQGRNKDLSGLTK